MSETQTTAAKANGKPTTEYEEVKMEDGRTVKFAGKRQIDKTVTVDEAAGTVNVRFDFRNGKTLSIGSEDLTPSLQLQALGHGLSQKCGDEAAGEKDIDDIVVAIEDVMTRLKSGDWKVAREAGDSFSGSSVVIKAIGEATGKSAEEVKAFLQGKLDASKAAAEKSGVKALTRAELYASFRNPNSKTGKIIARLEAEKAAKAAKVNADELLAEIG